MDGVKTKIIKDSSFGFESKLNCFLNSEEVGELINVSFTSVYNHDSCRSDAIVYTALILYK